MGNEHLIALAVIAAGIFLMHRTGFFAKRFSGKERVKRNPSEIDFAILREKFLEKMNQEWQQDMIVQSETMICGRQVSLWGSFDSQGKRKLLGMIDLPYQKETYAHEYRAAVCVSHLKERDLVEWWKYALELQENWKPRDCFHDFTMISLVLLCEDVETSVARELIHMNSEIWYKKPLAGWSYVRIAVVDLSTGQILSNKAGKSLAEKMAFP